MEKQEDDAEPGPSHLSSEDVSNKPVSRRIQFDAEDDNTPKHTDSKDQNQRRASMVGQSGYVSQLLEEYVSDESPVPIEEPLQMPIRKQSLAERRASVKAAEDDVNFYMREITSSASKLKLSIKKSSSKAMLPTVVSSKSSKSSKEKLDELKDLSQQLPDESHLNSEWKPTHLLEDEHARDQQACSWVGSYTIGKDYWATEANGVNEEPSKTFSFTVDEERKPWYDMPLRKQSVKDSKFWMLKHKSVDKIEALKDEINEEYEEKRKRRLVSAALAREEPKVVDEWSEEFKDYFYDISRASEFSQRGTTLSMADADKWLEKAGILDHDGLTLIHTGFCFLSCSGTRHRGLSFTEFTQFLQMISYTTKLPLRDIVRKLIACQRTAGASGAQTDNS